jgi:hypothetical protein
MNAALLGLKSIAESMLVSRALTAPAIGYRFEGFAPHEQDFEREWCLGVVIVGVFCKNQPLFFVVCCCCCCCCSMKNSFRGPLCKYEYRVSMDGVATGGRC